MAASHSGPGYYRGCRGQRHCNGASARGVRILASVAAVGAALSSSGSEALPAAPDAAVLRGSRGGLKFSFPPGGSHCFLGSGGSSSSSNSFRPEGFASQKALSCLRGGGFGWGDQEQQQPAVSAASSRRGASGLFGTSWGGGGDQPNNNDGHNNGNGKDKGRVETRGPPDLNTRLPPTAPGARSANANDDNGSGNPYGGGGGGGGGGGYGGGSTRGRDRVKTSGPPDAGVQAGGGGRRGGGRASMFSSQQQQQQRGQQEGRYDAGAAVGGGRSDQFWPSGDSSGRGGDGEGSPPAMGGNGRGLMAVHYLVLSCFGLFSLNTLFGVDRMFGLSLDHNRPRWWQAVTSLLLHGDQHHLMGNMFNLVIFGKMAEEDMGSLGMLMSFISCGVVSSVVSLVMMPRSISSCGASGAIFGLYSVCVLGKMFNVSRRSSADGRLRKLIEAAVFGWFVVESVMSEMRMVAAGGVRGTDHAAHFGGVFAGAVLILLARRSIRDKKYEA